MKKKRILIPIAVFCVCFLLLTAGALRWSDRQALEKLQLCWGEAGSQEAVSLFERDGSWYGFLPAHAGGVTLRTQSGVSLWLDGEPYRGTPLEPEGEHTLSVHNLIGQETARVKLVMMRSENIPAISLRLTSGSRKDLKESKICRAYMTVTQPDAEVSFQGEVKEFSIRGNYTATLPKTSYALKFKNAVDLLGTGADMSYCLIANTDDQSRMRNKIVYDAARELGLAYSPASRYVDVYVDGDYYGLYLLTERVDVAPNRVNLTQLQKQTEKVNFYSLKHYEPWSSGEGTRAHRAFAIPADPADITGGYLVEQEFEDRLLEHDNTFVTEGGVAIAVKYPARCSVAQINYIADFFRQMENAIGDGTYDQWIDVESWAKYYLVEEFFAQQDGASIYFYKDSDAVDPKLYAGPVWDFDWSIGLGGAFTGASLISPNTFHFNVGGWFRTLYQNENFRSTVAEIYERKFKTVVAGLLDGGLENLQTQIAAAHAMDAARWDGIYPSPYGIRCDSLEACTQQIAGWLDQRLACMDSVLLEGTAIVPVKLVKDPTQDGGVSTLYYAEGSSALYLPELRGAGYVPGVWYDESGNPADLSAPVTENTVFYAKKTATEPTAEESTSGRGYVPTDTADYIILICFAVLGLYVGVRVLADLGQNAKKKGKNHEH